MIRLALAAALRLMALPAYAWWAHALAGPLRGGRDGR